MGKPSLTWSGPLVGHAQGPLEFSTVACSWLDPWHPEEGLANTKQIVFLDAHSQEGAWRWLGEGTSFLKPSQPLTREQGSTACESDLQIIFGQPSRVGCESHTLHNYIILESNNTINIRI